MTTYKARGAADTIERQFIFERRQNLTLGPNVCDVVSIYLSLTISRIKRSPSFMKLILGE